MAPPDPHTYRDERTSCDHVDEHDGSNLACPLGHQVTNGFARHSCEEDDPDYGGSGQKDASEGG
jgi:hypothetical protein